MKIVVFLGPSLPLERARALCDATYRPPAKMGDIHGAVVTERPDIIALIDGFFDSVPAVWHKEILHALAAGVRVVGASSMGALRAAELAPFGMAGAGRVFEAFANGALEDDDEVAVAHTAIGDDYACLSVAMVSMRFALAQACAEGVVTPATRDALIALAKRRPYFERHWDRLWADGDAAGLPARELRALEEHVTRHAPDAKRDDAETLLRGLSAGNVPRGADEVPAFSPTIFWDRLVETQPAAQPHRGPGFLRFAKATEPDLKSRLRDALLHHLVDQACRDAHYEPSAEDIGLATRRFRIERGLLTKEQADAWFAESGLAPGDFARLMRDEACVNRMLRLERAQVDVHLVDAIARAGRLGIARERFDAPPPTGARAVDAASLEAHFRTHVRTLAGTLREHAQELGFASSAELLEEIRRVLPAEAVGPRYSTA